VKTIRWGILGYARIAELSVMPAIVRATGAELFAVASRDPAKLAACQAKFGVQRLHSSYEALLADPEVDAVYVPLPNSLHCEWTLRAAEAGKHVLCEKPMGLNAAQCREMTAACTRHGVKLMEAFMYRYTERTRLVLDIIDSGILGEIRFIEASFRFLLDRPESIKLQEGLGGGSLYDVGCYPVNFAGMIVDRAARARPGSIKPVSVAAKATRVGGIDQLFSGILQYESGIIAAVNSGFNAHKRVFAEVVGTQGVLEVPDPFFDNAGTLTITRGEERLERAVPVSDRYRAEVEDFGRAIREDSDPLFPLAETFRNAEVIDQLLACVQTKN
jgi:xylose dehydrogenase (NAD/NADP)